MSEVGGTQALTLRLERLARDFPDEVARALYAEAQEIRTVSMRRTPVDTGTLRASHMVSEPTIQGNTIEVRIGVGGPAAPYALYVHENLSARHGVGQAKFLESAVLEAMPTLARRIAARIAVERGL